MLITKTPLRISLIGGGTDQEAFYSQHPGCVVSMAINLYIYISVNRKFDGKFRISYSKTENVETIAEIEHPIVRKALYAHDIQTGLEITSVSDIPGNGTGLGSSSAFTVGLLKALGKDGINPLVSLAERAYKVERASGNNNGMQDVYASVFGGMNQFVFHHYGVHVNPILPSRTSFEEFESHCLMLWTGITRDANEILRVQEGGFSGGGNIQAGIQLASLARDFYIELMGGADMKRIGEFVSEGWEIKKFFASSITNKAIDVHYAVAMNRGAYGGKLLGAGGGGFLFFVAPPDTHEKIVMETGLKKVEFKIEPRGSEVIYDG